MANCPCGEVSTDPFALRVISLTLPFRSFVEVSMSFCFSRSLSELMRLPEEKLHARSLACRARLGSAEFAMALCMLAWQRRGGFREMGYSSVTEYAERALQLSGQKLYALLATARALEHLPKLCQAYQNGTLCWSRLRAIKSLATPETEHVWLEWARKHRSDEVARMVSMSPREWKWYRALDSSLKQCPIVTPEALSRILLDLEPAARSRRARSSPQSGSAAYGRDGAPTAAPVGPSDSSGNEPVAGVREQAGSSEREARPGPQSLAGVKGSTVARTISFKVEMSFDQYAVYESAEALLRSRAGKRLSQGAVLALMAEQVLNNAPSRARAKHQILIHAAEGTDQAWYETHRGRLPAAPEIVGAAKMAPSSPLANTSLTNTPQRPGATDQFRSEKSLDSRSGEPKSQKGASAPGASSAVGGLGAAVGIEDASTAAPSDVHAARQVTATEGGLAVEGRREEKVSRAVEVGYAGEVGCEVGFRGKRRRAIPVATLRAVRARSGGRCECCGDRGPLQIHHRVAVSEGGGDEVDNLEALCQACHLGGHQKDYVEKPRWRAAREAAIGRRMDKGKVSAHAPERIHELSSLKEPWGRDDAGASRVRESVVLAGSRQRLKG